MESVHISSPCDDSDCKFCRTVGSSLEDSSFQMEDNEQDLNSNKNESHQFPVNELNLCQRLESSCNLSFSTNQSSYSTSQQTGEIPNTLQSSQALHYQSSQNKGNICQDTKSSFLEIQSSGNLQTSDLPETEFSTSQIKRPHGKKKPNQTSDLNPLTVETSETSSKDRAIQETQMQIILKKLSLDQNLPPSLQKFAGSNINRIQEMDEENQPQLRHAQTVSESLHSLSHKTHESAFNCEFHSVAHDSFKNKSVDNRVPNTGGDSSKSKAQRLHLVTVQKTEESEHFLKHQQSEGRVPCTQSSSPRKVLDDECCKLLIQSSKSQTLKQSEDRASCFPSSPSKKPKQPERDTKATDHSYKIDSVMDEQYSSTQSVSKNEPIENPHLCTQQHSENRILEAQGFPQVPQVFKVSIKTEHSSAYSLPQQQQSKQRSPQKIQNPIHITSCVQSSKPQQFEQTGSDLIAKQRSQGKCAEKSPTSSQGKVLQPSPYSLSEQQSTQMLSQRLQHSKDRKSCTQIPISSLLEQTKSDAKAKQRPQVARSAERSHSPSQGISMQPSQYPLCQQQQSMPTSSPELQQSTDRPSYQQQQQSMLTSSPGLLQSTDQPTCIQSTLSQEENQSKSVSKAAQISRMDGPTEKTPSLGQKTLLQRHIWDDYELRFSGPDFLDWFPIFPLSTGLHQSTDEPTCIQSTLSQEQDQSESGLKVEQSSGMDESTEKNPSLGQNTLLQRYIWDDNKLTFSGPDVPGWFPILERDYFPRENLLIRFLWMCANQNIPPCQTEAHQHFDLSMHQRLYANSSETVNILVYGPTSWTTLLIKTFSRGTNFPFTPPCVHALTKNITRGSNVTTVSVFQLKILAKSMGVIRTCCFSAKTTIILVFNVANQNVEENVTKRIESIRRRICRDLPITFVVCKCQSDEDELSESLKMGYKLKAKYNLSAFSVCSVDLEEEVDSVFYNAMDVSR